MVDKVDVKGSVAAPVEEKKPIPWRRLAVGTMFVLLGLAAAGVGVSLISYRMTHYIVESGLINGRTTQLRSPIDGNVKAFYARPGVSVRSGQVLARIGVDPSPQQEQIRLQIERTQQDQKQQQNAFQQQRLQIEGEVQTNLTQLTSAQQTLEILKSQLLDINRQYNSVGKVNVQLANKEVAQAKAALDAANAKTTAARLDYERYAQLLKNGIVPQQKVDQLRFAWESAKAEVQQAQANLNAAKDSLRAFQTGVTINNNTTSILDQRTKLMQLIQTQTVLVNTLKTQLDSARERLKQTQAFKPNSILQPVSTTKRYLARQDYEVAAPFAGIVYKTDREPGEQINRTEAILTMLDCNELWVEAVVPASEVSSLQIQKPVSVQIAGYPETIAGEIDLIQPVSGQGIAQQLPSTQAQALSPSVPPNLAGQPLARVTVRIPPPPQYTQSNQFCGVGQLTRLTFQKKPVDLPSWQSLGLSNFRLPGQS
ncbi:HlyD family secretion protein [Aerosakkonemataceae cyanobacterium BLCC-F154]|uniref:HlyD family secretion protein n=1 Tax=Floridaenema fluviatile BLCC-F154 TaxID=3153640 RepID=A0ABV4YJB6_9CYAN